MSLRKNPPDRARAAEAVRAFLRSLGLEIEGELIGTPERVADAWIDELIVGLERDPHAILAEGSLDLGPEDAERPNAIVALRRISVAAVCPHHLLPSHGYADVVYLPSRRAAGLGAIASAVQALSQRPVLQETLTTDIAHALFTGLDARGAACRLELAHTCFIARGERQSASTVRTLAFSGSFAKEDRALALAALAESEAR